MLGVLRGLLLRTRAEAPPERAGPSHVRPSLISAKSLQYVRFAPPALEEKIFRPGGIVEFIDT